MTDRIRCIHCEAVGYVRQERVVRGNTAFTEFYCGRCDKSWREEDGGDKGHEDHEENSHKDHGDD